MPDDIFDNENNPDQDHPVTRGQMRMIVSDLRKDLRWAVAVTIVANQTISHVELPHPVGFISGGVVILIGAAKLAIAR